jgi:hypothetical protein
LSATILRIYQTYYITNRKYVTSPPPSLPLPHPIPLVT